MIEINNTTSQKLGQAGLQRLAAKFLLVYKKPNWDLSIAIIGPSRMRRLNNQYRKIDKATDVLSFAGDARQRFLGEIVINIAETKKPGKYREVLAGKKGLASPGYLLSFLLIHGLLHLVGYDDKTEAGRQEMIALGREFLAKNR